MRYQSIDTLSAANLVTDTDTQILSHWVVTRSLSHMYQNIETRDNEIMDMWSVVVQNCTGESVSSDAKLTPRAEADKHNTDIKGLLSVSHLCMIQNNIGPTPFYMAV